MIESVRQKYSAAFREHGDCDRSVFFPKGRQFVRFNALLDLDKVAANASLLDYGCGLGKMVDWLTDKNRQDVLYTGADITTEFINHNQAKYSDHNFLLMNGPLDLQGEWDIILASGVFSMRYDPDVNVHKAQVFEILTQLFHRHARHYLAVDFMHDQVDYQQDGAFHLNIEEVSQFVKTNLTRRFDVIRSHLPFEFALRLHKNTELDDSGVYKEIL